MKQCLDAYLVLGCGGFETPEGFIICNAVTNPMVDLSKIPQDKYMRLITFLDKTCKLFERPSYDYNKSVNIITMLYRTYGILNHDELVTIQRFIKLHRDCGIFLILLMKEDYDARTRSNVDAD
tara:strand:+ start:87 stop:455 length:369 start_codon:yes stop_codon:yes gene_type:complete